MDHKELVARTYKENAPSLIGALMMVVRDLSFAEDLLQEAMIQALKTWSHEVPKNPAGWLLTAARRRAIDRIRHRKMSLEKQEAIIRFQEQLQEESPDLLGGYGDERLRLIFTCCHPALSNEAQVALTLKTVCGLSTQEISSAFLVNETTLAQRIVRAKNKIKLAGIPYLIPELEKMSERMDAVLSVIYLVFNAGYHSSGQDLLDVDLCVEAIRLSDSLVALIDAQSSKLLGEHSFLELQALCALMKVNHARVASRVSDSGRLIVLEDQDRCLWNQTLIDAEAEKIGVLLRTKNLGPYQIQAAIAALHGIAKSSEETDWEQIVGLYDELYKYLPSDVVRLNRAAAVAMAYSPEVGLQEIEELEKSTALRSYALLPAAKADLNRRIGRFEQALRFYKEAVQLSENQAELAYYQRRIDEISDPKRISNP